MSEAQELAAAIAREFRRRVVEEYVPRIRTCVEQLDEERLWDRPGTHNNSVANLLLHLEGNVRQWILCGIGGQRDDRDRDAEFAARPGPGRASGAEMMARLEATVGAAAAVVDALGPAELLQTRTFQSRWEHTCLAAVIHVLEHFSGHAGQIYAYTKQVLDVDLKFWDL